MACTVPWPFRKWFDSRFKDICDEHDALYTERVWRRKWEADIICAYHFANRGHIMLAWASLAYNAILGTPYWLLKKLLQVRES